MNFEKNKFLDLGFAGPYKIFDEKNCEKLLEEKFVPKNQFLWTKSIHEKSTKVVSVASKEIILDKIKEILGKDILLWGSCFIEQKPGHKHPWHIDLEYKSWDGVTIWIGLKNLNNNTPLSLITHTHKIDNFPQALEEKNINIENDNDVLTEAKKNNENCELKTFYLKPGEFIIWSGKVWHKTLNHSNKKRESIILQYCSPNNIVKIPLNYNYREMRWSKEKPTCILMSGEDKQKFNKILEKSSFDLDETFLNFFSRKFINYFYKLRFKLSSVYRKFN